jgi:hypothetical protein
MSVMFRNTLQWPVHVRGYEWRRRSSLGLDESPTDTRRHELMLVPVGAETKTYMPEEHPDLFRKFANLDGSAESILDFANDYGRLVEKGTDGESIVPWQREIQVMNHALTAWDFLSGRSTARELVRRLPNEICGGEGQLTSVRLRGRLAHLIETILNPTPFSFQANTVTELSMRSHALLLPQFLAWDDTRRVFQREIGASTSLLLLLWSQAAGSFMGVRDFRKCKYAWCSVMIEV